MFCLLVLWPKTGSSCTLSLIMVFWLKIYSPWNFISFLICTPKPTITITAGNSYLLMLEVWYFICFSFVTLSKLSWHIAFSWIFGKRYSGYSGYSKEHPMSRNRWPIYPSKYFLTEVRCLEKTFTIKKTFKKSIVIKLWPLISPKATFPKTTKSELFEPWGKTTFTGAAENAFLHKVDTY